MKGLDAAIVVGGPAAVLVTADFALEPMHKAVVSLQFTVFSSEKRRPSGNYGGLPIPDSKKEKDNAETQRAQRSTENGGLARGAFLKACRKHRLRSFDSLNMTAWDGLDVERLGIGHGRRGD